MEKVLGISLFGLKEGESEIHPVMRELDLQELDSVSGGWVPAIAFAGAVIGHTGVMTAGGGTISMGVGVVAHVFSAFGLGYAAYSLGTAYGAGGPRNKKPDQR